PPGTLIRIEHLAPGVRLPPDAVAWRILYHSRTLTGADTVVSGLVVAPSGPAPSGGFPVVDYAHATTGLAAICAPSRFTTLEIPSLSSFIRSGDAVVATDYEGLGTSGPSSYVLGNTEGYAVLDADRAARQIPGLLIGRRVVVLGYSQGGQAALFAGQLAPSYAPSVDLRGVVAEAPAVELPQLLVHLMSVATFNGLVVTVAVSWSGAYPRLPLGALLSPAATALAAVTASGCETQIVATYRRLSPAGAFTPTAFPTRATTNPVWQDLLEANSPGAGPLTSPTLIVTGSADAVLPESLVTEFVDRACSVLGDPITYDTFSGAGHGTITSVAAPTVDAFVATRLAVTHWPRRCSRRLVPSP
ncbi:MAG: alpha/beta fold hydrolase, partial [Acidimicrobiales bacterium]